MKVENFWDELCVGVKGRQDYALNLSILLSAGKENNNDPLSNGE